MSTGTLPGAVVVHRLPQQVLIDRAKNLVSEIERADFLAAHIVNINRCHMLPVFGPTTNDRRPTNALTPSSLPASRLSTDQPSLRPRIRGALVAASLTL